MSTTEPACIGGLHEACVGVPELAAVMGFFERSGTLQVVRFAGASHAER